MPTDNLNLNNALPIAFKLPPVEAIKYLKAKGNNITLTNSSAELTSNAHHKAFTIAGVMKADVLQKVLTELLKAQAKGTPLSDFKSSVASVLNKSGWEGLEPHRLTTIFNTNMQIAFAKGQYDKQVETAQFSKRIYWKYVQVQKNSKRKGHARFHNKVFHYQDAIWQRIYPPCDFNCKCRVIPLTLAEVKQQGLKIEKGNNFRDYINENPSAFSISPIQDYNPDFKKYMPELRKKIEELLKKKNAIVLNDEYNKLFEKPTYTITNSPDEISYIESSALKQIFSNQNITIHDLANMTGAPDGSQFNFSLEHFDWHYESFFGIKAYITNSEFQRYSRIFFKDKDDNISVYNDYFLPKNPNNLPKGVGAMALFREIQECRKFGVKKIYTYAYGDKSLSYKWTGYKVWPALGFNAAVPKEFLIEVQNNIRNSAKSAKLIEYIKNAKSMHEIMDNPDTKILWSKFGSSIYTSFDIDENSDDYKHLIKVLKKRGTII